MKSILIKKKYLLTKTDMLTYIRLNDNAEPATCESALLKSTFKIPNYSLMFSLHNSNYFRHYAAQFCNEQEIYAFKDDCFYLDICLLSILFGIANFLNLNGSI